MSAPVIGFSPFNVGFLQRFFKSKLPKAASVKSAFSTSASMKLFSRSVVRMLLVTRKFSSSKSVNLVLHYYRLKMIVSYLVPVNTAFLNMAPFKELPLKLALSTMAFEKSASSNLESFQNNVSTKSPNYVKAKHIMNLKSSAIHVVAPCR